MAKRFLKHNLNGIFLKLNDSKEKINIKNTTTNGKRNFFHIFYFSQCNLEISEEFLAKTSNSNIYMLLYLLNSSVVFNLNHNFESSNIFYKLTIIGKNSKVRINFSKEGINSKINYKITTKKTLILDFASHERYLSSAVVNTIDASANLDQKYFFELDGKNNNIKFGGQIVTFGGNSTLIVKSKIPISYNIRHKLFEGKQLFKIFRDATGGERRS